MIRPTIPIVPQPAQSQGLAEPACPAALAEPTSVFASAAHAYLQPGPLSLQSLPPLALYVHFPWCVRKCPYCDFNSHAVKAEGIPEVAYLDALCADLEQALPMVWGRKIHTVFIGGGTPSLLSAAGLDRLLADIRARMPLEADAEITLEANPGTAEAEKFRAYRASGVTRLSLGIQSFHDGQLRKLGRIHSAAEAQHAIALAQQHFDNINLDLMFALPEQTLQDCQQDVRTLLSFGTSHVSLYHLTLEPNTLFAAQPPVLPDDDTAFAMQDDIGERLDQAGYQHYEVSAYAKPGRQCRHNLNYWQFGDYLGIGAGAHGKLSFPHRIVRQMRHKHPQAYIEQVMQGKAVQQEHEIAYGDLPFEFMLNALRLTQGVPVHSFAERTGVSLHQIQVPLNEAVRKGLLQIDHLNMRATPLGQRFLNDLQSLFLQD